MKGDHAIDHGVEGLSAVKPKPIRVAIIVITLIMGNQKAGLEVWWGANGKNKKTRGLWRDIRKRGVGYGATRGDADTSPDHG